MFAIFGLSGYTFYMFKMMAHFNGFARLLFALSVCSLSLSASAAPASRRALESGPFDGAESGGFGDGAERGDSGGRPDYESGARRYSPDRYEEFPQQEPSDSPRGSGADAGGGHFRPHGSSRSSDSANSSDSGRGSAYNRSYIVSSALAGLPFADVMPEDMTLRERKAVVAELKKRMEDYNRGLERIKAHLRDMGEFSELADKPSAKSGSLDKSMPIGPEGSTFDASRGILTVTDSSGGAATAFFAKIKDKTFIVTNVHVMGGGWPMTFKTVSGVEMEAPSSGFVASGQDVYIMPVSSIPEGAEALPVCADIPESVSADDSVVVCGNSEGGGVLLRTAGKILAVGPEIVETNCAIYPGNSGSPVYHRKSRSIIGVISHAIIRKGGDGSLGQLSRMRENSAIKGNVRYFAQRVDNVRDWVSIPPEELSRQAAEVRIFARKLYQMEAFRRSRFSSIPGGFDYPDFDRIAFQMIESSRVRIRGGGGAEKKAYREFYEASAKLVNHEIAAMRAKKINECFQREISAITAEMIKLRDDYFSMARSPSLQ